MVESEVNTNLVFGHEHGICSWPKTKFLIYRINLGFYHINLGFTVLTSDSTETT